MLSRLFSVFKLQICWFQFSLLACLIWISPSKNSSYTDSKSLSVPLLLLSIFFQLVKNLWPYLCWHRWHIPHFIHQRCYHPWWLSYSQLPLALTLVSYWQPCFQNQVFFIPQPSKEIIFIPCLHPLKSFKQGMDFIGSHFNFIVFTLRWPLHRQISLISSVSFMSILLIIVYSFFLYVFGSFSTTFQLSNFIVFTLKWSLHKQVSSISSTTIMSTLLIIIIFFLYVFRSFLTIKFYDFHFKGPLLKQVSPISSTSIVNIIDHYI